MDSNCQHDLFDADPIGIDDQYGGVTLLTCSLCNTAWLHYFIEYEAYTASGRWFRGVVPAKLVRRISAQSAVDILGSLPWHLYGGSHFGGRSGLGIGKLRVGA